MKIYNIKHQFFVPVLFYSKDPSLKIPFLNAILIAETILIIYIIYVMFCLIFNCYINYNKAKNKILNKNTS